MAYLPILTRKAGQQVITDTFRGINRGEKVGDGEFAKALNLSTREYPMLCPRKPRGTVRTLAQPGGMIAKDTLCWVDGATVYCNGTAVAGLTLSTAAADMPKQLVGFGSYVVIFPDKKYFNTIDLTDKGSIDESYAATGNVTYTICRLDGSDYGNVSTGATAPEDPDNGDYWIDTSDAVHKLMVYSTTYGMWQQIVTVYTRISAAGIDAHFAEGDTITLSGVAANAGESSAILKKQLEALNGSHYVYGAGSGYITVVGLIDSSYTQTGKTLRAERKAPDMEYVIESENRLWGCHYGPGTDGKMLNEIYACKLGDFKNWRVYQGISTDSYTVSVGTDGPFTGAIAFGGYPMFFKENCVHKVYGSQPKNFQVMTTQMRGVQQGSGRSLAIVDGTLMYLSAMGVEAYDGSLPICISQSLGDTQRSAGVAGTLGTKYYIALLEGEERKMYVYDARFGIWLEEDGADAQVMVPFENDLWLLDGSTGEMLTLMGSVGEQEGNIQWMAETGLMGWEIVNQKYVSRFNLRGVLPEGGTLRVSLQYDSKGPWHEKLNLKHTGKSTRTVLMPVYPHRCDHMRLRIEGSGEIKLYSLSRILTNGGDGQRGHR